MVENVIISVVNEENTCNISITLFSTNDSITNKKDTCNLIERIPRLLYDRPLSKKKYFFYTSYLKRVKCEVYFKSLSANTFNKIILTTISSINIITSIFQLKHVEGITCKKQLLILNKRLLQNRGNRNQTSQSRKMRSWLIIHSIQRLPTGN